MKIQMSLFRFLAAAILLSLAASSQAQEAVGRVLLSAGETFALRDGKPVRLQFNSPIHFRDTLRTGAASSLQVRFVDESLLSLRDNTEFAIEEYRFAAGSVDGTERSFFRLVKGGFRAVTGLIGRNRHENYRVRTETATVGIRGTDFAVRDCRGDCGAGVKDGLYGTVLGLSSGTNQITVNNNTGETVFGISQHFYVPDANTRPQPLLQPPSFVAVKPQGKAQAAQEGGSGSGGESTGASSGAQADSRPSAPIEVIPTALGVTQAYQVTESLGASGTPEALPAANGFLVVYPLASDQLFGNVLFDGDRMVGTYNGLNHLVSYGTLGTFPSGSVAGGSVTDTGSLTLSNGQTFAWGRWTGNTQVTIDNGTTLTGVPVLFGTASGVQQQSSIVGTLGGVGLYGYAGGPRPVDAAGNLGSITSSTLKLDFTQMIGELALGISFPSIIAGGVNTGPANFDMRGQSFAFHADGDFFGSLTGSCTGGGCIPDGLASGIYNVGLTGPNGYGLAAVGGVISGTQAGDVAFLNAYLNNSFTPGPAPIGPLWGQVAFANASVPNTTTIAPGFATFSGTDPIAFGNGTTALSGMLNSGTIADKNSSPLVDGGTIYWGRWTGPSVQVIGSSDLTFSPSPTGVPFVVGNANTVLPTSGSFLYSFAGGPSPVSTAGTVGTISGGSFNITFGATNTMQLASAIALNGFSGVNYSLDSLASVNFISCSSGVCTFPPSPVMGNIAFNTTCTGPCNSPASSASAIFVGPQAGGLAVAGNVTSSASTVPLPTVSFGAAFKR